MKKRIYKSVTLINFMLLCVIGMILLSCSSDSTASIPDGNYVTCNLDGTSFTSSSMLTGASYGYNILTISGISIDGEKFVSIGIYNPVKGKTYNLIDDVDEKDKIPGLKPEIGITAANELDENYIARPYVGSATITLTFFDGESASGTFSAEAVHEDDPDRKISITNGKFSITSVIEL